MVDVRNLSLFSTSVIFMSLKPMLLHHAQEGGARKLDPMFFLMCSESLKIALCLAGLGWLRATQGADAAKLWLGMRHTMGYCVPAAVFLVMNSVTVYANSIVHPATFQLIVNIKIMTTAVVGRVVLSKVLSQSQWAALFLLTLSTMLGTWSGSDGSHGEGGTNLWSFLVVLLCATLSAFGSIATERQLKNKTNEALSIFATNVHMAMHTLIFNSLFVLLSGLYYTRTAMRPFSGSQIDLRIVMAFTNEALNGIVISQIMRRVDSNAKNFASSAAIFFIAGCSAVSFGYFPSRFFFVAAALVVASVYLYNRRAPTKKELVEQQPQSKGSSGIGGSNRTSTPRASKVTASTPSPVEGTQKTEVSASRDEDKKGQ